MATSRSNWYPPARRTGPCSAGSRGTPSAGLSWWWLMDAGLIGCICEAGGERSLALWPYGAKKLCSERASYTKCGK